MKQFPIFVLILLFHYCLAPHFGCPKDRPFRLDTDKCGNFSNICIKYKSEECEIGIRACEQCPLSNFSSTILGQVIRTIYGVEDKNCSQPRDETKSVQECSIDRVIRNILIIVYLMLIVSILLLLYFIYQYRRARKRKNHERSFINHLSLGKQNHSEEQLKKYEENQKYFMVMKLEEITKELSLLPNKMKSGKPTEISISWENAENGDHPFRAIKFGNSCFIARAEHKDEYIPGKLIPKDKCAYIGCGGLEIQKSTYQVLVDTSILNKPHIDWKYASGQDIPLGAIIGGTDNGCALYIAKGVIEGEDVLGKFLPQHRRAYFPIKNEEIYMMEPILVLCYFRM